MDSDLIELRKKKIIKISIIVTIVAVITILAIIIAPSIINELNQKPANETITGG